jgi:hypothetical protein
MTGWFSDKQGIPTRMTGWFSDKQGIPTITPESILKTYKSLSDTRLINTINKYLNTPSNSL